MCCVLCAAPFRDWPQDLAACRVLCAVLGPAPGLRFDDSDRAGMDALCAVSGVWAWGRGSWRETAIYN